MNAHKRMFLVRFKDGHSFRVLAEYATDATFKAQALRKQFGMMYSSVARVTG